MQAALTGKSLSVLLRVSHENGTAGNPQEAGAETARDGAEKNQPLLTGAVNKVHASSIRGISKSADLLARWSVAFNDEGGYVVSV
jgi:hypothetical protein